MANEQKGPSRAFVLPVALVVRRPRARWVGNHCRSATSASGTSKKRAGPRSMARAAATGRRLGRPVGLLHLHGCGAGSVAGTGSAAGWLPPSPWVRSCPCLFCLFFGSVCSWIDCGLRTGPARAPGRRAFLYGGGCPGLARRCRYAGCLVGTARLCAQQCQIDASSSGVAATLNRQSLMRAQTTDPGRGKSVPNDRGESRRNSARPRGALPNGAE